LRSVLGKTLSFESKDWTIVGHFEAQGSLIESEIWMQKDILNRLLRRQTDNFAVVRMESEAAVEAALPLFHQTGSLERYFQAWSELEYYKSFGGALAWILWLSSVMVVIITLTGALIGANTMYTAVMNRMKEIATYRVLGFWKSDVLMAFLVESVVLSFVGGLLGLLLGVAINGLPLSLSHGAFYLVVDGVVMAVAIGLTLFVGIVGGLFPAIKGVNKTIIDGLRYR
jgi:putative ABC transport system permease protein